MELSLVLSILVKAIAFVIGVLLVLGGMFRMHPHSISKNIYMNVMLVFLGSVVLLIGVVLQ